MGYFKRMAEEAINKFEMAIAEAKETYEDLMFIADDIRSMSLATEALEDLTDDCEEALENLFTDFKNLGSISDEALDWIEDYVPFLRKLGL